MRLAINKHIILYLLILTFLKSAFADKNINQIKVEADNSIEYFEKQKVYVASGNAKVSKGNFSINAQKITAFMGKTESSNISHIQATGNVIIINKNNVAKSDTARYNFLKRIIFLEGKNQSIETKKFRLQSKNFISYDDINKIAKSEGDINLFLSGEIFISSRKIDASFDKINNNLIKASAEGKVKIETNSETITCNSAKFDNRTKIISLKGNVIIKRDESVLTGEKGNMNLITLKSKIESSKTKRVKGTFSPINK